MKNSRDVLGTVIYECVQFGEDAQKSGFSKCGFIIG